MDNNLVAYQYSPLPDRLLGFLALCRLVLQSERKRRDRTPIPFNLGCQCCFERWRVLGGSADIFQRRKLNGLSAIKSLGRVVSKAPC